MSLSMDKSVRIHRGRPTIDVTQLSMNERLRRAGIETILTGRSTVYGMPEKGLTDGNVCIYRPKYEDCPGECLAHFGVRI